MELAEKLEEAFVAYLQTLDWPEALYLDADDETTLQIFPGENSADKNQQCIVCVAEDSSTEEPSNSGNRIFPFRVELRTPVADPTNLASHKDSASILENALLADGLSDLVNAAAYAKAVASPADYADLDNFCLYPVISRTDIRAEDEELHLSGKALSCYCMAIKG